MAARRLVYIPAFCALLGLCAAMPVRATEYYGQVFFGAVPVPGATVTVTEDAERFSTVTDEQGLYLFANLADGPWKIEITMRGFAKLEGKVTVAPNMPQGKWELKMLGLPQLLAGSQAMSPLATRPANATPPQAEEEAPAPTPPEAGAAAEQPPEDENAANAQDGLLINGSESNAATTPYSLSPAFGNHRPGSKALYNGSAGAIVDNSALDARPYSLTGGQTPKAAYSQITTLLTLGGPLRIPHLMPNGPNFFVAYQWTRNANASTAAGLVPDTAERGGDLAGLLNAQGQPVTIYDPSTGLPFTGNIPVNPQAAALLNLYPPSNITGNSSYNYQTEILNDTHADALQSRLNKTLGHKDQLYGGFGFRSIRADSVNLFGFVDTTNTLGIDANVNWSHRYLHQTFVLLGYHFTRLRTGVRPAFENRANIAGQAGITGNDQDPADWGPPSLTFSSGIASLGDGNSAFNRDRTDQLSVNVSTSIGLHNFSFGGDFRRQEFNQYQQQDPRGSFTFTGAATRAPGSSSAATGSDLADFLFGVPDTSTVAFGNPDKYFRQPVYDLYFNDDWRLLPELTINAGMRWDYGAPMTEMFGRLVNLDVAPGFTAVAPVVGSSPTGPLTGVRYPSSLVRPDMHGFEPRIGIAWRPLPASTLVVRAGYGIYDDTSVYLSAAEMMAQQAPLSTSLSVANSSACALTLANGFPTACAGTTADTFAIDPNLRVGYAQVWQLSAQRDLPWALVMTATYQGTKGTHGMQEFLPNTYPIGAVNPCPSCPEGFVYRTSGGNSTREAGTFQLRRRLRSGFTATVDYTYAKAIDDDVQLGAQGHVTATSAAVTQTGPAPQVAQNWLDPRAERGLSTFDQRHLVTLQAQYTTGMGLGGGTLMSGWRGTAFKQWTAMTQITIGSGLPETPIYVATVPGTGFSNVIRPDPTGAPLYAATGGYHLNNAAFTAPASGQWGTARRDSITGPSQFSLDSALSRTFSLRSPLSLDVRFDATNMLNHATYTTWVTTVNSATFGLPAGANGMRTLQVTTRLRF